MIQLKNTHEIQILREGGAIHARILSELVSFVRVGMSTMDVDTKAQELLKQNNCESAFLGYKTEGIKNPFPAALCISVNEEIVHGIPSDTKILKEGDVVKLDLGVVYKGLYTDMATTVIVGKGNKDTYRLIETAKLALQAAVEALAPNMPLRHVGKAVEKVVEKGGCEVFKELCGHGVGFGVHEEPYVLNYSSHQDFGDAIPGMVLALEPLVTLGKDGLKTKSDGWTIVSKDNAISAHEEVTVLITETGVEVLTQ